MSRKVIKDSTAMVRCENNTIVLAQSNGVMLHLSATEASVLGLEPGDEVHIKVKREVPPLEVVVRTSETCSENFVFWKRVNGYLRKHRNAVSKRAEFVEFLEIDRPGRYEIHYLGTEEEV